MNDAKDSLRIIVADASKVTRKMIGKVIAESVPEAEVVGCNTAAEALEILIEDIGDNGDGKLDVILTDVYLKGGLTGKELLEKVRDEMGLTRGQLPVLVMTGDDNPKNQSALIKAGANDLVEKPIEEKTLINKLRFQLQLAAGFESPTKA